MGATIEEKTTVLEFTIPELYPTHTSHDLLTVEEWHVAVGDIIQPQQLLVTLDTPPGVGDIYAPEGLEGPHRVVSLAVPVRGELHLSELLIQLEAVQQKAS